MDVIKERQNPNNEKTPTEIQKVNEKENEFGEATEDEDVVLCKSGGYVFKLLGGKPQDVVPVHRRPQSELAIVRLSNTECPTCGEGTLNPKTNKPVAAVTMFTCGHGYHTNCVLLWSNNTICPVCSGTTTSSLRNLTPKKPFVDIMLDLEKREAKTIGINSSEKLTYEQKCALLRINAIARISANRNLVEDFELNLDTLLANKITMQLIFSERIRLDQVYWRLGVKNKEDLKVLAFGHKEFLSPLCEVSALADLYCITYLELEEDFGIKLSDCVAGACTVREMNRLKWTMSQMIKKGLTREQFLVLIKSSVVDSSNTPLKTKTLLGCNPTHIGKLGLTATHFVHIGWSFEDLVKAFNLEPDTCRVLKLSVTGFAAAYKQKTQQEVLTNQNTPEKSFFDMFGF